MSSKVTAWESLGNNLQYNSLTIAENEEMLREGWDPLHVQMGFKRDFSRWLSENTEKAVASYWGNGVIMT